jgi:putative ABC transport system permease protein
MFGAIRITIRSLARTPGFTLAAMATLALGVAFTTAMFAVVDGVLLRPLPIPEPERVVMLRDVHTTTGEINELSLQNFEDLRRGVRSIESAAPWILESRSLADGDVPERVHSMRVSPSMFRVLGVSPAIGREFRDEEAQAGGAVILTNDFWRSRFGASPSALGKVIRLDGQPATVVGVLPEGLRFPSGNAAIWEPLVPLSYEKEFRAKRMFNVLARLAPGAGMRSAAAEVDTVSRALAKQYPSPNRDWRTETIPARDGMVPDPRPLWLLLGAAGVVLLLACVNVANLLLARATAARDNAAVRAALGARRLDLALHALREAAVIAAGGTLAGVALGAWIVSLIEKFRPSILPSWTHIAIDVRVLAASVAVLAIATLLAGTAPAIAASRERLDFLHARGSVGQRRSGLLRRLLTATQVALAVVLLVCAMLLVRTLAAVQNVDKGFRPERRLAATLFVPERGVYRGETQQIALFTRYLERVRAIPGVLAAGGATSMPLNPVGISYSADVFIEGFVSERPMEAALRVATPDYFRAIGIPIVTGREFLDSDTATAPRVAVVNQAFVKAFAAGRNPIGLKTRVYCGDCDAYTIVGIAGNTRHDALDRPAPAEIFVPYTQNPHGALTVVAHVRGDADSVARAMRQELMRLDPDLALANIAAVEEIIDRSLDTRRFNARLLVAFSVSALLLAAIGLYGSLSFSLSQRRRDIAVRIALGAQSGNLWRLVFNEAASPVVTGIAAGIAASFVATASLKAMMFGVTTFDLVSYAAVLATFGAVVALVTVAGFRRTASTDVRALLSDT